MKKWHANAVRMILAMLSLFGIVTSLDTTIISGIILMNVPHS